MIFKKNIVYSFLAQFSMVLTFMSCQPHDLQEKQASGVYKVDFNGFEDEFTEEEILFYQDVYLELNYNGTFTFSKIIRENSRKGTWWLHDSVEFDIITLKHNNGKSTGIGRCAGDSCLTKIKIISDDKVKNLPFIKIEHQFPEFLEE